MSSLRLDPERVRRLQEAVAELERVTADRDAEYRNGVRDDDCDRAAEQVILRAKELIKGDQ